MVRWALLLVVIAIGVPLTAAQTAPAEAASSDSAAARKPKQKKKPKKKPRSHRKSSRKKKPPAELDDEPITLAALNVAIEPAVAGSPSGALVIGEVATFPDPPRPRLTVGGIVATSTSTPPRDGGPTWFFGVRAGPSVIDRRGYYNFRSNRQTYHDERNVRGEVALGRYLGRHVSLAVAGGTGPFPKFDEPDPLLGENTRFSVYLFHSRLDLDLHAGAFVLGIGGGGAYEYTTGSFTTQDPTTFEVIEHTATFKRFGVVGAARTGVQLAAGPFAFELLAEATVLKLFRGTYVYTVPTEGLSDREMGYAGSLLLGVRLQ
jgi:hypothetical protein